MALVVREGADPICRLTPVRTKLLRMSGERFAVDTKLRAPPVAHKPLCVLRPNELRIRELRRPSERPDDVRVHEIHIPSVKAKSHTERSRESVAHKGVEVLLERTQRTK